MLDKNTYALNGAFFDIKATKVRELMRWDKFFNSAYAKPLALAPPMGVRCVSSSVLGTAQLDGRTSTFGDFQRSDPHEHEIYYYSTTSFGHTAVDILQSQFFQHYLSGGLPGLQPSSNTNRYEQFIDSEALLRSVNLAYAWDAFDLMYAVTSGFKREWPEPGLTSSREGKILAVASLIPGVAVGYLVLALFCIWAIALAGLGIVYGFRKRPGDALDGYMMLRKGADMADDLKENEDFMNGKPFRGSKTLTGLRGG